MQVGQGKRKVWAMIVVFPLQSLCVQGVWVGIQVVIRYATVEVWREVVVHGGLRTSIGHRSEEELPCYQAAVVPGCSLTARSCDLFSSTG